MVRLDTSAAAEPLPAAELLHPSQLPADSLMARVLPLVSESIDALPVLPEVAQRIVAAIHDPLVEMREVARLLGEDAVLGSRVLQLANSAAYGGTQRIQTLLEACTRLGLKRIANVVHMAAQADIYRSLGASYREFLGRLWRHGIATAHCMETVATWSRLRVESAPFLTGLIHDIGKLVLADTILNRYSGPIGRLADEPELLLTAVADYHALAGLHAVQKWGLPSDVILAVYFQSRPQMAPTGDGQALALAV
jgi:HD-like signal output (HDOD) protein